MSVTRQIRTAVIKALQELYGQDSPGQDPRFSEKDFQVNQTKPEFEGDYTVVLFSLVKQLKKSPVQSTKGARANQTSLSGFWLTTSVPFLLP